MEARVCILSLGFSPKKYLLNQSNGQCAQRFCNRACRRQLKNKRHHPCWKSSIESCERSNTSHEEIKEKNISRATLIWRAIKLPIYSVALVPLSVGSAAAYLQTGIFSARRYSVLLASSVLIITWLNLSNDVYDYDTGADKNKKESVVNMVGSRTTTLAAAYVLLVLGSFGLAWVSMEAGSIHSLLLLASAITCGYMYQCPPFRLSYQGLGEPLCFAAFGPFATTAFYLLQSSLGKENCLPLTPTVFSASLLVGFTTALILFCSHFHQIEGDRDVGKMSPLVRLGTEAGSRVVSVAIITLYSLLVLLTLSKALPLTCIFCCGLTLPIGKLVAKYVEENHKNKTKIFMAKYYCVRLHALFGSTLVAGLVIARMISNRQLPHLMFP
ncbi:2-carboxy-1,4-naphthoquinone phytyltransferase, chloroplastic isoform X1 [Malania oleifera]|uniref:2-carboxy-1,4-naphthoquinone phytyltransferase, chloroplastic isoform X1 n=1 Tax=Malania oleifera TaxID=397392 RepID=UPI0025AE0CCA|nr:2-carboxy-1,4-naphthoquinone phytyltransferase, chloroplastic isoform X1 [Malania oleifera]XP_057977836.1 2-carboxy-1,4-naphthoquinone phytyltransferase, chloroplastic isoform X1 [Malania oleifera]